MNLEDMKYISASSSSLGVGSDMTKEDLMFFTDGLKSQNFPFGKTEDDFIKFSVYNFDNTLVTESMIYPSGSYRNYTQSYYDPTNRYITYSYSKFDGTAPILVGETSSLFIDVSSEMRNLNVPDGNYRITVELMRNIVGSNSSSEDKLMIYQISTNRDEVALIPKNLAGSTEKINTQVDVFGTNKVFVSDIADSIIESIASPEIYNVYYTAKNENPSGAELLKFYYGFTNRENETNNDIDVISFVTDLYYGVRKGGTRNNGQIAVNDILGIYDQFKNWLYSNYDSGSTFRDIQDYYYSLFRFVIDQELNRITNKKPAEYDQIVAFLQKIYYDLTFYPQFYFLQLKYNIDLSGYFKNILNHSGGYVSITNKKLVLSEDPRYQNKLVLKLSEPLPQSVQNGDDVWITNNFGFLPIVQNVYYFTSNVIQTIPLRGPNFLVRIESQGNSTEALSMEQLIAQTGSAYNEVLSKILTPSQTVVDNTNYRSFENFINFSSAKLRVDAFTVKKTKIDDLYQTIAELQQKIDANPNDQFYIKEKTDANTEIDNLENSMDGYEKFLYNNPSWYTDHNASSSLFDRDNGNSLINNLPQFILEDMEQNQDYILFVGMIGHFFDNISLLIRQITEKNNYSSSPNYGISVDIVEDMLASLGWDAEISKENLPLLLSNFSQNDFDTNSNLYDLSRTISEKQRNQIIWKRILNTLPYIYKTKGTEASLSSLLSCFGVPKNIIKLKEYGGIQDVHNLQDTTLYVLDEVKYEPYFSGSGEYFKFNWTGSAQTLELNFSFDPNKTSTVGNVFRLVNCPNSWVVGVYRDKGKDWGRLFFSIDNGSGSVKTIMTDKAPFFDGNSYHAMLRRNDATVNYSMYGFTESQIDEYPIKYDIIAQRAEDARITFEATSSQYLSGSYNTQFRSGSYVYVGNYNQNTASLNIDPEAFFGNIDEIKLWELPLDDGRFESHTLYQNAYDGNSPEKMIAENLVRISFERPTDLHDSSTSASLNNLAFRKDFPTFTAVNFPESLVATVQNSECDPSMVAGFPYQFSRKDTRQTVKLPDYGSSKFRSNKINYVDQELAAPLSSTERSSLQSSELVSVDSNRLGLFFSPSDIQNTEIIKFFGEYPLSELIGDPSTVYESSYARFEKFRQIFYDQGFGNIDYQFFMNVVRFYFDKAMFKYIRSIVPARATLVDGILVEPSILERPKIALKPLVRENIPQKEAPIDANRNIVATQSPKLEDSLDVRTSGRSILNDVNQVFFPTDEDQYGFAVYSDNGITYYNGDYYRADVLTIKKQYQIHNKYNLPTNALNDYEKNVNLNGTVQTVTSSYQKINLAKLPVLTEYTADCSLIQPPTFSGSFSGSISFDPGGGNGFYFTNISSSHTIDGVYIGKIIGDAGEGIIQNPGIKIRATYIAAYPLQYGGQFSYQSGTWYFNGYIYGGIPATINLTKFSTTFYTTDGSSVFDSFRYLTQGPFFGPLSSAFSYRKAYSMQNYPYNATLLNGYFSNHYKYSNQQFSVKEINSYDNTDRPFKWKKGSQNKKTTVDPLTGLLDNTEAIETKTV
jgi:hypothetical protein